MKRVIDGRRYDTETAELLAWVPSTADRGDFRYHETAVYRTPNGRYFLAGEGNAMSVWANHHGNTFSPGCGLRALSEDEARAELESCGSDGEQALERYFQIEEA